MKRNTKNINQQLLRNIQPPVSEVHKDQTLQMIHQLNIQEEQKPMKKKGFATVLLTALMLIMLTGAALGIANHFGVIDFLSPTGGEGVPVEAIQTVFTHDTCIVDGVSIRVRDAVSDGRTLFVAVEAKAENENDAVLVTLDAFDHANDEAMDQWLTSHTNAEYHPDFEALGAAETIHYLFPMEQVEVTGAGVKSGVNPVSGLNWRYEGTNTIVANLMIDLQKLENPGEVLDITMHPTAAKEGTAKEYAEAYGMEIPEGLSPTFVPFVPLDEGLLTTQVKAGSMDIRVARAEEAFTYGDFHINSLEVATSPLATYITVTRELTEAAKIRRSNAYIILDENGNPFENLSLVHVITQSPNADGSWDGVPLQNVYKRGSGLPKTLTLRAMEMYGRDENVPLPDDLIVTLTEVQ